MRFDGYARLLARISLVTADTRAWIPAGNRTISQIGPAIAERQVVEVRRDCLVRIDFREFRVRTRGKPARPVDDPRQTGRRHARASNDVPAEVCRVFGLIQVIVYEE